MTMGEKIGEARRATGLSQAQVAERLEVSRQAVSKWETDASRPDTENLLRLAELFDVPLEELALGRAGEAAGGARTRRRGRRAAWAVCAVCAVLFALLAVLHWGSVALEAGGTSWDSPERARAYAGKIYDKYGEGFMAWAQEHAKGLEGAGLLPDSLDAAWSGRELQISFRLGPNQWGQNLRLTFTGTRVWPGTFRWEGQAAVLET